MVMHGKRRAKSLKMELDCYKRLKKLFLVLREFRKSVSAIFARSASPTIEELAIYVYFKIPKHPMKGQSSSIDRVYEAATVKLSG
jgi:hypothetical protein